MVLLASPGFAQSSNTAGQVIRAQGQAMAISGGENRVLQPGSIVAMDDTLVTLENSRVEIKLIDGTTLTLGEKATLRINALIFNQSDAAVSRLAIFVEGAMRMLSGRISAKDGADVQVNTPASALAVRGTDFWTGPIDGQFGVLLVEGEVNVRTLGGEVTLSEPGSGTNIADAAAAPGPVRIWPQDKVDRALAQVAFQ